MYTSVCPGMAMHDHVWPGIRPSVTTQVSTSCETTNDKLHYKKKKLHFTFITDATLLLTAKHPTCKFVLLGLQFMIANYSIVTKSQ